MARMSSEHAAQIASANVRLKHAYPHVQDGARAIAFALDYIGDPFDCVEFFNRWREGDWRTIKVEWPEYFTN